MADWMDESQEYQLTVLQEQIARATRTTRAPSAYFCEDCGSVIPEKRRKIIPGVQRCIECQEINELRKKNYRPV
ncbi:phage/conjugal plasmid C-4 type zinc finger TraR family protein [Rahnella sp. BIGb0603]|jgi:phage/conjugal plasmid C-4 type zinc finger TraR family protein|nr:MULTISPECIES: TraR/DksA family transcriptional regulator [unclassified Rahnella]KAB8311520.1 TraR/DksA family transcriptional regulator [Rouxiella chamberiensis]MCS3425865.1 phage/conjugal plasmid C-4 type zinc finger TraR family protein [Rahnella sp. BIGb0603]